MLIPVCSGPFLALTPGVAFHMEMRAICHCEDGVCPPVSVYSFPFREQPGSWIGLPLN